MSGEGQSCIFKVGFASPDVFWSDDNRIPSPSRKIENFRWPLSPQCATRETRGELIQFNQYRKPWHFEKSELYLFNSGDAHVFPIEDKP